MAKYAQGDPAAGISSTERTVRFHLILIEGNLFR
jgi:hypothetical protein